ncbi:MAG TPA: hypothetical protein V6C65_30960 [Allocoleopsis sp.]
MLASSRTGCSTIRWLPLIYLYASSMLLRRSLPLVQRFSLLGFQSTKGSEYLEISRSPALERLFGDFASLYKRQNCIRATKLEQKNLETEREKGLNLREFTQK